MKKKLFGAGAIDVQVHGIIDAGVMAERGGAAGNLGKVTSGLRVASH
jgi:hypothetical protein